MEPHEAAELLITGISPHQFIAIITLTMLSVCSLIGVICWILKIYLTPLKNIPEQILEIKTKIKGEGELDRMIRIRIQEHELNCTYRNGCKQASK